MRWLMLVMAAGCLSGLFGLGLGAYSYRRLDAMQAAFDAALAPAGGWRLETTLTLGRHTTTLDEHTRMLQRLDGCVCGGQPTARVHQ